MTSENIHLADYLIILGYIGLIFILAFKSGKITKHRNEPDTGPEEQYLAGKSLTFWESLCSIIATEVSALTFLGIPAFAYSSDFSFLQIYIGAIFGRLVIASAFLPRIYDKGITLYGIMSKENATENGQRTVSLFYVFNKVLSVGVRLYTGSILISEFFNLSIYTSILIICVITFFYTLIGGLKAVVRTDMLQMGLFVTGGVVAHFLIPEINGESWDYLMSLAYNANKLNIENLSGPGPYFTGIICGFLFDMATHGSDQDYIQRLIGNKSLKKAQLAIFSSSALSICVGSLFLGVGALLWSHYQTNIMPPDIKPDYLFAHFITQYFPTGLKGLMVAGVLAATMSTLDSTINALSSCMHNDIFPNRPAHHMNRYYKIDTISMTLLLLIIAFVSANFEQILVLGLKITSWTAGSLLAILIVKLMWKKWIDFPLNPLSISLTYLLGVFGVYINTFQFKLIWHWNVYFGFTFSMIAIVAYSALSPKGKLALK
jgi:SSS family solute:Na+ symporter